MKRPDPSRPASSNKKVGTSVPSRPKPDAPSASASNSDARAQTASSLTPASRSPRVLIRIASLLWSTLKAYFNDKVPRLGAALAFYTTIAVAPLLMLAIAVAKIFFKDENARQRVIGQIDQLVGGAASQAIASVQPAQPGQDATSIATWVGLATLLFGGLGVFVHLQDALNTIWRASEHAGENWRQVLKRRLFSFGTVVATGFVMLVSLTLSAALTWLGENARAWADWPAGVWETFNFVLSFVVIAYLFAMIFKLLPDVYVRWRDVWTGAAVTALLFVAGKTALGIYLARSSVTSAYGAAGSVIALLLWCYYAAQILFFGAEFTRVHAATQGGRIPLPKESTPA